MKPCTTCNRPLVNIAVSDWPEWHASLWICPTCSVPGYGFNRVLAGPIIDRTGAAEEEDDAA